uniref:Uncharacterized protein n=1 Tax=Glossina brevipalpis TaxID=37001 RepID=A0A1A9W4H0_9MUSC
MTAAELKEIQTTTTTTTTTTKDLKESQKIKQEIASLSWLASSLPQSSPSATASSRTKDEELSATTATQVSSEATTTVVKKPSLLPKPKVKVIIPPPVLLQMQQQQQQQPPQQQTEIVVPPSPMSATTPTSTVSSRIPVRTANGEKRAMQVAFTEDFTSSSSPSITTESDTIKSKAMINDGAVIIREREKILDEKIVRRTEEVPCPITGRPQLRTVEYIEKIIETEVETSREKIISLELQDPEKGDTPQTSLLEDMRDSYIASSMEASDRRTAVRVDDDDKDLPKYYVDITAERKLNLQIDDEEEGEEEEIDAASIVTVQANTEKLFLRTDDDELPSIEVDNSKSVANNLYRTVAVPAATVNSGSSSSSSSSTSAATSSCISIKPALISMHQTLAKEVLVPVSAAAVTTTNTIANTNIGQTSSMVVTTPVTTSFSTTQRIVEVVNPLIAGDGQVQSIIVSRSEHSEYPSFDRDDEVMLPPPISPHILRSETFVLPTNVEPKQCDELSLNAKMKNVLEELLENERVKYNLQKSLEQDEDEDEDEDENENEEEEEEEEEEDNQDNDNCERRDSENKMKAMHRSKDEIDFGVRPQFKGLSAKQEQSSQDNNGNQERILNELMRDSNRNTIRKLAAKLSDNNDSDDNVGDNDGDDGKAIEEEEEDEEESEESDDITERERERTTKTSTMTTTTPTTTTTTRGLTIRKACDDNDNDKNITLEHLLAEQKKYEEITKQLRKSVESLLIDDNDGDNDDDDDGGGGNDVITSHDKEIQTTSVITTQKQQQQQQQTQNKRLPETTSPTFSKKQRKQTDETGEEIFNRLLNAGKTHKQIFDQETDETLTTSTTSYTDESGSNIIITTTSTSISNIVTSGIPRSTKITEKAVKTSASSNTSTNDKQNDNDEEDSSA